MYTQAGVARALSEGARMFPIHQSAPDKSSIQGEEPTELLGQMSQTVKHRRTSRYAVTYPLGIESNDSQHTAQSSF
jgi:hypothetical protein